MKKCARCNIRKPKRYCPALGTSICSLCCGQIREKEVHCPSDCSFLNKHKSYQEKRIIEKRHTPPRPSSTSGMDILKDERMAWLAFHIETPVKDYAEKEPSFNDREVFLALEHAKDKIAKDKGLFLYPEKTLKPKNDLGEAIFHMIERCRFEGRIILTGESQNYSKQEKILVLERIIGIVKQLAGDDLEGRSYIQTVMERFSRMKELSRKEKVLTIS